MLCLCCKTRGEDVKKNVAVNHGFHRSGDVHGKVQGASSALSQGKFHL